VQNGIGAVAERLERRDDAAMTDPDKGSEKSSAGSTLGSWMLDCA
jgi:hypothetical protein